MLVAKEDDSLFFGFFPAARLFPHLRMESSHRVGTSCPHSFGTLTEHVGRRRRRWDSSGANWLIEIRSFWG